MAKRIRLRLGALLGVVMVVTVAQVAFAVPAFAYVPVSGSGSTWSFNALDQWRKNVRQFGIVINYSATGSSDGRSQFRNGTVDFAVSEIPYGLTDGGVYDKPPSDVRGFTYMPIVAGGTAFMYNLKIGNSRVTNLRLSGEVLTKIFTGVITNWSDPAIKADNPGLELPARKVVPVVRSDGSGTTAQFTAWMADQYPAIWDDYCRRAGRQTPCGLTSNYPSLPGVIAQSGSLGVSGYVAQAQSEGTITYVEYSYALNTDFPVAKVLNTAQYYVEPTASSVAVGLLGAEIDTRDPNSDTYLTQQLRNVYTARDPRAYPLSSYSYMILPTDTRKSFSNEKGGTLSDFGYYFLCEGQQQAEALGYSPLPINLVQAGMTQLARVPGTSNKLSPNDVSKCNNPTLSPDGGNALAKNAPNPSECDKKGVTQCAIGTGGAKQETPTRGGGPANASPGTGGPGGAGGGGPGGTTAAGQQTSTDGGPGGTGPGEAGAIDPDTGLAIAATGGDASGGDPSGGAFAVPVAVDVADDGRVIALRVLFGVLLLSVIVGPPIVARYLRRRRGGAW
ncbi:MAG: phosphate ABC transporter substrate-binding protein PstS [Pseudonocardiaceae bacterium]